MRKLIFISFIVFGATVGLFSALHDDWGVKAVMMTVGAVVVQGREQPDSCAEHDERDEDEFSHCTLRTATVLRTIRDANSACMVRTSVSNGPPGQQFLTRSLETDPYAALVVASLG